MRLLKHFGENSRRPRSVGWKPSMRSCYACKCRLQPSALKKSRTFLLFSPQYSLHTGPDNAVVVLAACKTRRCHLPAIVVRLWVRRHEECVENNTTTNAIARLVIYGSASRLMMAFACLRGGGVLHILVANLVTHVRSVATNEVEDHPRPINQFNRP
jgi:hypothetical protein